MQIGILGATSQIAKDLIASLLHEGEGNLVLFARKPGVVEQWLLQSGLGKQCEVKDINEFSNQFSFELIINFIGSGDPGKTEEIGKSIFDITLDFDRQVMDYLAVHPTCQYIFLSSGAAYGSNFERPVENATHANFPINNIGPSDWYGISKFYAECRHRAAKNLAIVDIRIFNYFSHTQDMQSKFLMAEIVNTIESGVALKTSSDNIWRDYIGPADLLQLISKILNCGPINTSIDAYTKSPVDKFSLFEAIQESFPFKYSIEGSYKAINATGKKANYYSLNYKAADFGYQPTKTSLDNILTELSKYFNAL